MEDERGGGFLSEDDYDALNDQTFGSAMKGDWETQHESMVRMDKKKEPLNGDSSKNEYDDLEMNLSKMKLENMVMSYTDDDDSQSNIKMDPSVWSNDDSNSSKFLSSSSPFNFSQISASSPLTHNVSTKNDNVSQRTQNMLNMMNPSSKRINTLEDIERTMKQKQMKQPQQQQMSPRSLPPGFNMPPLMNRNGMLPQPPPPSNFNPMSPQQQIPPGFNRMPPGYPPFMPPPRPPMGSLPIALNNFAMHPSFNAMRPNGPPPPMPFHGQPHPIQNQAQFNQQLLNEIQRNHPLLGRHHPQQMPPMAFLQQQMAAQQQHQLQQQHQQHLLHHNNNMMRQQNQQRRIQSEDYDEYANLMSTRDKHWLIGIQLSQLNSDTPYIDDYYYTTYRERKAKKRGDVTSKTHKDNQMNHPLTQPKGQHAKLVLVQLGNKNGNRNGQNNNNNRERRNSDDTKDNNNSSKLQCSQFENSLGKLQYGSVTAPRKLIDMAIDPNKVRTTTDENQLEHITAAASMELSVQRKHRLILLHIETLYKILLKLEDSVNPSAIIAYAALKVSFFFLGNC